MSEAVDTGQPTDHDLLRRMSDDLDGGFVDLMGAYSGIVFSVALSVTGCRSDADDLAAEAFLRAYRALRGFSGARIASLRPRPWLVTILLNTWRNAVRDSRRRPPEVPLDQLTERRDAAPDTEQLAELNERQRELVAMLRALPEPQRVSVVLRHVVGLPITEIAAVLDCPEGTAKSHISRGLQRLRDNHKGSSRP